MSLSKAILLACFIFIAAPAAAQEASPPGSPAGSGAVTSSGDGPLIKLKVDREFEKLEAAYKDAIKNFSKEQLDALKKQEDAYMKTTNGDIALASTELQLKFCSENNADLRKHASKYQSGFGVLRSQVEAVQRAHQARLRTAREAAVPFIDQKILDDHYAYLSKLVVGLAKGMLEASYESGGFAKTDCQGVMQKIDAAVSRASPTAPVDEAAVAKRVAEMKKDADGGDTDAMTNLGLMQLSGGTGIPKDTKAGLDRLTKAAELGYGRAQYMLGLVYSSDMFGTQDKEKARYWLGKAAAKGEKKAAAIMQALDKAPPPESGEKRTEAGDRRGE